jgi:hypothetical protein
MHMLLNIRFLKLKFVFVQRTANIVMSKKVKDKNH